MSKLQAKVQQFIEEHGLIKPGSIVLAAVSGGADSVALLFLLHSLQKSLAFDLAVAHLEHGLRGEASLRDRDFVAGSCQSLGVPFHSQSVDVRRLAQAEKRSLEDAGRQARRRFFFDLAAQQRRRHPGRKVRVALAHHQDDQAETLLMHLGRGCGLAGLAGMQPESEIFIRPLLFVPAATLKAFLRQEGLSWRQDETNETLDVLRNRLRHNVLPAYKQALAHDPAPLLSRTAQLIAEDLKLVQADAESHLKRLWDEGGLQHAGLIHLPEALQRHVLRGYWQKVTASGHDLSFVHLQSMIQFLQTSHPGQCLHLPRGWRFHRSHRGVALRRRECLETASNFRCDLEPIPLALPGRTTATAYGLQIEAHLIENERQIVYNDQMECFQLDRIQGCCLRYRRPGDRIRPWPRRCGKSLKKLFNELKVPSNLRDRLPLLAVGSEIIWIPGHASHADHVARQNLAGPGAIVCLQLHKQQPKQALKQDNPLPDEDSR